MWPPPVAASVSRMAVVRLAELLKDPNDMGGLASLAGLARPLLLAQTFNVGTASGSVTPAATISAPVPGREEVGLLGAVAVRLNLQRVVTITITTDAGQLVSEQFASAGLKKPQRWTPFDTGMSVVISNPSSNFYVVGEVFAPLWYVKRVLFDALRRELVGLFPDPAAAANMQGIV